jgi:hypothetical protein
VTQVISFDEIRAALARERGETATADELAPAEPAPAEPEPAQAEPARPEPAQHGDADTETRIADPPVEHPIYEPGPAPVPYRVPGPDVEPPPLRHLHDTHAPVDGHDLAEDGEPRAGLARKALALLVIFALIALIVFLVLRGLAR